MPSIINLVQAFRRVFHTTVVPAEYRSNFTHLYFDIGWFGVLSGSAINFLNVYATRLGATGFEIGLFGAVPAFVSLTLALSMSRWLERRPVNKAVFWTSVLYRIGFLLWVPLPWLLAGKAQVWVLIAINLLMAIPLTALGIGFNALFASAVPSDWRAYVAGIRNVVLSCTFMLTSLLSGYLLDRLPFPQGYQLVFFIGFVGAAMSSFHLYFVKPLPPRQLPFGQTPRQAASPSNRSASSRGLQALLRLDVWKTPFRSTLLAFLAFHLSQYLAIPLFPIFQVRDLNLTDQQIGLGTALFYFLMFFGSTQLSRVVRKLGHKSVTGWGVALMCLYPMLMAVSTQAWQFYVISAIGGMVWALVGGAYANYLLENCPEDDRPAHLAWYNIILNACILVGSLLGPFVATGIGLVSALILFGAFRLLAGVSILKWG